jgi:hypothetical protein
MTLCSLLAIVLLAIGIQVNPAQASPTTLDFESLGNSTYDTYISSYSQNGYDLTSSNGDLYKVGTANSYYSGSVALYAVPYYYYYYNTTATMTLKRADGKPFSLLSIDLSTVSYYDPTVTFTGTLKTGGTVTQSFAVTTYGSNVQTFQFTNFKNLTQVQWTQSYYQDTYQWDNIVVDATTSTPIACSQPPANDNFLGSSVITGATGTVASNNGCATTESGEPNSSGASVWYSWTAPQNGNIVFDTSGSDFDTTLGAYTGSSVGGLSPLAFNDDTGDVTSRIAFDVTAGTTYSIKVAGYNGSMGNFNLHWTLTPYYRILGRIATSSGTAVANVTVTRTSGASAVTNSSGYYTLTNVPPGTYAVTPSLANYTFTPASKNVTVSSADVSGQNFVANPVFTISGHVRNAASQGVPGVSMLRSGSTTPATTDANGYYSFVNVPVGTYAVSPSLTGASFSPASATVSNASPTADFTATFSIRGRVTTGATVAMVGVAVTLNSTPAGVTNPVQTDANGYFSFTNLPNGTYSFIPSFTGYVFNPASRSVTIATSASTNQDFVATRAYNVSGRITDATGVAIANVSVSRGGGATAVTTDTSGNYTLPNVLPGTYTITPTLAGYRFTPTSLSVTVNNADVGGQNFTATAIFTISGTVTNNGGTVIPNISIAISPVPAGVTSPATTNAAGAYSFIDVAAGSYTITPSKAGCSFTPASKVVTPGAATANFVILFNVSGHISKNGVGLPGVSVALTPASGTPTPTGVTTPVTTNSTGDFLFTKVPAGLYYVTPTLSGYSFTPNTQGFSLTTAPRAANFTAAAIYSLSGHIANSAGTALQNVSVALSNGSTSFAPVLTDGSGNYSFNGLVAGTYTVTPSLSGYSFLPVSRNVTLSSANATGQNFVGGVPFAASGKVANSGGTGVPGVTVMCSGGAASVTTDSSGNYSIPNLPAGSYTVTPDLTNANFVPTARTVTPSSSLANFTAFFSISGHIAYGTAPLANVSVALKTSTGATVAGVTSPVLTNSSGNFKFTNVPSGLYYVTPTLTGYSFTPATQGLSVTTAPRAANFTAAVVYRILGRITTSAGVALANVQVSRSGAPSGSSTTQVFTNSAGYYTFNGVPNGTYTVTPSQSGKTFTPTSKSVTVNNADASGQNFIGS